MPTETTTPATIQTSVKFVGTSTNGTSIRDAERQLIEELNSANWRSFIQARLSSEVREKFPSTEVKVESVRASHGSVDLEVVLTIITIGIGIAANIDGTISLITRIIKSDVLKRATTIAQAVGLKVVETTDKIKSNPIPFLVLTVVILAIALAFAIGYIVRDQAQPPATTVVLVSTPTDNTTELPRPTLTIEPSDTPSSTLIPTLQPSSTPALDTPSQTPSPVSPFQIIDLSTLTAYGVEPWDSNLGLVKGRQFIEGIEFYFGWNVMTEGCETHRTPTTIDIPTDVSSPTAVHILFQGGNMDKRYTANRNTGSIILTFSDGQTISIDLVLGDNVRSWTRGDAGSIETVTSPDITEAEAAYGTTKDGQAGSMDILHINIPEIYRDAQLISIQINDTSRTNPDFIHDDPCIHIQAITVETGE